MTTTSRPLATRRERFCKRQADALARYVDLSRATTHAAWWLPRTGQGYGEPMQVVVTPAEWDRGADAAFWQITAPENDPYIKLHTAGRFGVDFFLTKTEALEAHLLHLTDRRLDLFNATQRTEAQIADLYRQIHREQYGPER